MITVATGLDRTTLELSLKSLKDFAKERLPDEKLLELEARDECPLDIVREMCGGAFDVNRVCEGMARIDLGLATAVLATFLGSEPIGVGGTTVQKKYWMARIADEALLFAYAATEPEAGSDLAALRSTVERVTKDGRIVG